MLYHPVTRWLAGNKEKSETEHFYQVREDLEEGEKYTEEAGPAQKLKRDMESYNAAIYASGQQELKDAWSYEQPVFDMEDYGIETPVAGSLKIDAMEVEMPVYLGATEENMAKGAVVLGQTSMPTGGENTNCVIAAHRGYGSVSMFRDIEKIQTGDLVVLETLWGTLEYEVREIRVILPDDIDAIRIQEGRELLTLITCHPYRYNSHRYVVYCARSGSESAKAPEGEQTVPEIQGEIEGEEGEQLVMLLEDMLPLMAVPLIILAVILLVKPPKNRKKSNKRKDRKKTNRRKKGRRER